MSTQKRFSLKNKVEFYIGGDLMNAYLVASWDGTHIWIQWESPAPETKYELRIRFRPKAVAGKSDWEDWQPTMLPGKNWIVIPVMRPLGTRVQAQIRPKDGNESDWTTAVGATFVRSLCLFSFSTTKKQLHFPARVRFHCHVDGGVCTYRLKEEIEIEPGESKEVEMEAEASDGFSQLDVAGDFILRPMFGVTITNTEPSRNDLEATEKDFAEISMANRDGSFGLAIIPRQDLR